MSKTVAVIEGDDAAPEAVRPTIELVKSLNLGIEFTYPVVGEDAINASGSPTNAPGSIESDKLSAADARSAAGR